MKRIGNILLVAIFTSALAVTAAAPPMPAKPKRITVSVLGNFPLRFDGDVGEKALARQQKAWSEALARVLPNRPDLIVLPEACDRFAQMTLAQKQQWYRFRGDQMRNFFAEVAQKNHCYIAYSAARQMPDGSYRNSTELIGRDGKTVGVYHKNFTVPSETTEDGILCGKTAPVFETDFGKVTMLICFDLNFNELLQRVAKERPNLIIFSSLYHGGLMQGVWAYFCRSYFVSAFPGKCSVVNPLGSTLAESTNYYNHLTTTINLDYQVVHLDENQEKLDALKRKYGSGVTLFDPGYVGVVLVTSELPNVTAAEMIQEFKIEIWDEYYARSVRHRDLPGHMEK